MRKRGIASLRGGSLVVVHRSSSDLRLNVHYHALHLDGVYDARGAFHTAPAPSPEEIETILARSIARAERLLDARDAGLDEEDLSIAQAYAPPHAASDTPPTKTRTTSAYS